MISLIERTCVEQKKWIGNDDMMNASAFKGIRLAVGILILDAGINMIKKMKKRNLFPMIIMICSFASMLFISIFSWNDSSYLGYCSGLWMDK